MTISRETALQRAGENGEWLTYSGAEVTLSVGKRSAAVEQAQTELRASEQIVEALRRLLEPTEEQASGSIEIYLLDSADLPPVAPPGPVILRNSFPPEEEPQKRAWVQFHPG